MLKMTLSGGADGGSCCQGGYDRILYIYSPFQAPKLGDVPPASKDGRGGDPNGSLCLGGGERVPYPQSMEKMDRKGVGQADSCTRKGGESTGKTPRE